MVPSGPQVAPPWLGPSQMVTGRATEDGGLVQIRYSLSGSTSMARLEVFDVRGRRLRLLDNGRRGLGTYVKMWDRRDEGGVLAARGLGVAAAIVFCVVSGVLATVRFCDRALAEAAALIACSSSTSRTMRGGLARIISLSLKPEPTRRMCAVERRPSDLISTLLMNPRLRESVSSSAPASNETTSSLRPLFAAWRSTL